MPSLYCSTYEYISNLIRLNTRITYSFIFSLLHKGTKEGEFLFPCYSDFLLYLGEFVKYCSGDDVIQVLPYSWGTPNPSWYCPSLQSLSLQLPAPGLLPLDQVEGSKPKVLSNSVSYPIHYPTEAIVVELQFKFYYIQFFPKKHEFELHWPTVIPSKFLHMDKTKSEKKRFAKISSLAWEDQKNLTNFTIGQNSYFWCFFW